MKQQFPALLLINTKTKYVRISRSPKVVLAYGSETKDRGSMQKTLALLFLLYIEDTRKMENTSVLRIVNPIKISIWFEIDYVL
jgi:hypothetical protein